MRRWKRESKKEKMREREREGGGESERLLYREKWRGRSRKTDRQGRDLDIVTR